MCIQIPVSLHFFLKIFAKNRFLCQIRLKKPVRYKKQGIMAFFESALFSFIKMRKTAGLFH